MLKTYDRERSRNQRQNFAKLRVIGEIHKGSPKRIVNGKEIQGTDLDYFRFEPKGTAEEKLAIAEAFQAIYGDQPTMINFYLLADTPEQAIDAWFWEFAKVNKRDSAGKAKVKCDGDNIVGWCDPNTQKWRTEPKPCRRSPDELHCSACKPSGKMELMIPELWQAGFMGYVLFHVSSFAYDFPEIQANLEAIAQTRMIFGKTLAFAPLQLCRAKRLVSTSYPDPNDPSKRIPKMAEKSLCFITQTAEHVKQLVSGLQHKQAIIEATQPQFVLDSAPERRAIAPQREEPRAIAKAEEFYRRLIAKAPTVTTLEDYNRLYETVYSEEWMPLWAQLPNQGECVNLLMDDMRSRLTSLMRPNVARQEEIETEIVDSEVVEEIIDEDF